MPKVIITRATVAGGKVVEPSKTPIDVSEEDARLLIALQKAEPAPDKPAAKKAAKADD